MTKTNPLKWHGGKCYLAKRIIGLMPPHTHYVEPYFGGGAVLFARDPEGASEVVNDINGQLSNFWHVLGDPAASIDFIERLKMIPFSQNTWEQAKVRCEWWKDVKVRHIGNVPAAIDFFVRYRQSRQGLGKDFATLSRNRTRRGMNEQVSSWLTAIGSLPEAAARLQRVVILCADALEVIRQQDGPNTLFYLDPPYLHETRVTTSDYEHEMTADQHDELLSLLSRIQGKFILSGYRSKLYDECAIQLNWHRVDFEIDNKASSKKSKDKKTESLWLNYQPA